MLGSRRQVYLLGVKLQLQLSDQLLFVQQIISHHLRTAVHISFTS